MSKRDPDVRCERCGIWIKDTPEFRRQHECMYPCPDCKVLLYADGLQGHKDGGRCDPAKADKGRQDMRESMRELNKAMEILLG